MAFNALFTTLCFVLSFLPTAFAQAPSNDTIPSYVDYCSLSISQDGMSNSFLLYPLLDRAGLQGNDKIKGKLVHFVSGVTSGADVRKNIACISCDPPAYSGQLDTAGTISLVGSFGPAAIVLFSNTSTHCAFANDPGANTYSALYSMTTVNTSLALESILTMGSTQAGDALIKQSSGDNNANGTASPNQGGYDGHSPTTAVAMIILYSITGIITALFLMIIVVGAIRAHRHPERYGPRNMLGRPRQSRARGIARAMLETIPIVKFGEKEDNKPVQQAGDVELGTTAKDTPADRPAEAERRISAEQGTNPAIQVNGEEQVQDGESSQSHNEDGSQPEAVTTEKATAIAKPEGEADADANAENGLACSVCTDDFTKGQDVRVLPCNHKFHPECIDPWLLNVSGTCPLCRVDLRPTTSHTHDSDTTIAPDDSASNVGANESAAENGDSSTAQERRRSRTGLSLYLQHTLNRRRMRDATPEERVAALRRLRTVESAHEHDRARNRLSARISRAFHPDSRRGSTINPSRRGSAIAQEESRRGSYAG